MGNNKPREILQRGVYMADLTNNSIDSEMKDSHAVVVVSADIRNDNSPNIFVFPISHARKKYQPTHFKLYREKYDFFQYKVNTVMCEEGRSISKRRLCRFLGEIDEDDFLAIIECKEFIFEEKSD